MYSSPFSMSNGLSDFFAQLLIFFYRHRLKETIAGDKTAYNHMCSVKRAGTKNNRRIKAMDNGKKYNQTSPNPSIRPFSGVM